jgi:hypothetical protein
VTYLSLTYGVLPSREEFDSAFEREVSGDYHITLGHTDSEACEGFRLGDGEWSADQLWQAITEIVNAEPDAITVSEDSEWEDVYQVFYPGTDRAFVEIGPDESDLIEWAQRFCEHHVTHVEVARQALAFASAYGEVGHDFTRKDAAMDVVSCILDTLGFEWILVAYQKRFC